MSSTTSTPITTPARSTWRTAIGLSTAAVYGPFCVMTAYMLVFVQCDHCKQTAWSMLPSSPGILPVELTFRACGANRPPDAEWAGWSVVVSITLVLLPAAVYRRRGWLRIALGTVQFLASSILAFILMSLIRA